MSIMIKMVIVYIICDIKRPDIVKVIENKVVLLWVVLPFTHCLATLYDMFK